MREFDLAKTIVRGTALTIGSLSLYGLVAYEQVSASTTSPNPINSGEQSLVLDGLFGISPEIDFPGQPCVAPIDLMELKDISGNKVAGRQMEITPKSNPENNIRIVSAFEPVRVSVIGQRNAKKWVNIKIDGQVVSRMLYDATQIIFTLKDAQSFEKAELGEAIVACEPCEPKDTWARIEPRLQPTLTPTPELVQPTPATPRPRPTPMPVPQQLPGTGDASTAE